MTTSDAIKHFGKKIDLARALGLSPSAITQWGETVPIRRQYELERLTEGKLKVTQPVAARPRLPRVSAATIDNQQGIIHGSLPH